MGKTAVILIEGGRLCQTDCFADFDSLSFDNQLAAVSGGEKINLQIDRYVADTFIELTIYGPISRSVDYGSVDPAMKSAKWVKVLSADVDLNNRKTHSHALNTHG